MVKRWHQDLVIRLIRMEVAVGHQMSTPSSEDADPENVMSPLQASSDSGDYEMPPPAVAQKTWHRQHKTVSSVTADTRKILEQFLKRSTMPDSSRINSHVEHQYAVVGDLLDEDPQPTPYQQIGSDDDCFCDFYQDFSKGDALRFMNTEPDYVDCQMLVKELMNSEALRKSVHHRSHKKVNSPPGNVKFAVGGMKAKGKTKVKAEQDGVNDGSSSSTEDYEFPDTELLNRKKKSSFRLALERVRQSFRRQGKKTSEVSQDTGRLTGTLSGEQQRKEYQGKSEVPLPPTPVTWSSGKLHCKLHREGSETSKTQASGTPSEIDFGHGKSSTADPHVLQVPHGTLPYEDKKKKSPALWRKSEVKDKGNEEKVRENRGIFEVILRQFRKGSSKLKRKGGSQVGKQRFHSADNLSIHPPKDDKKKLIEQCILMKTRDGEYDSDFATARCRINRGPHSQCDRPCSAKSGSSLRQGHHSFRQKMHLDGLVVFRPQVPVPFEADAGGESQKMLLAVPVSSSESGSIGATLDRDRDPVDDSVDFSIAEIERVLSCSTSKPFSQKSDREKDELFEKIAEQLALIADHYNLDSPSSPHFLYSTSPNKDSEETTIDHPENLEVSGEESFTLDSLVPHHLSQLNSATGFSGSPAVAQLVKTPTYGTFKQIVSDSVGAETGWQQIAKLFRLTQSAIHLAGMGTSVAGVIKDMTIRYFEDRFASWIVGQGGWESMVEDTNTELDSELD